MNLFVYTAGDPTAAAVVSLTDTTGVDLPTLVLGDTVPLTVKFTDGTAAESWSGDASYTLAVALGLPSTDSTQDLAGTSDFSTVTNGWSGAMALTGDQLKIALRCALGDNAALRRRGAAPFVLQVRVTDAQARPVSYALLPVTVSASVL